MNDAAIVLNVKPKPARANNNHFFLRYGFDFANGSESLVHVDSNDFVLETRSYYALNNYECSVYVQRKMLYI